MSDIRLNYHRRKFEDEVLAKKQEPKCRIWNNKEIEGIIEQLCDQSGTYPRADRSLQHFRVLKALEVKELRYIDPYNKDKSFQVVSFEDLFDKLYWSWEQTGFAGWKPIHHNLREQGIYISVGLVRLFLEHSPTHQARISKKSQKSLVTNPILSTSFGSRGQVDLIDMHTVPDIGFKWILNYQDHFTKWVVLKPLKQKCAEEVASNLVTIFYSLGAPNILQSDNGKEFDNRLLLETLNALWPSTKIIHGKPRKPQSQGSVENANGRVENILQSLLEKESHSHWAKELDRVAYMKNTTLHTILSTSPYKVLYGRDPPRGLRDFDIPSTLHHSINTVEDLSSKFPSFETELLSDNEDITYSVEDVGSPFIPNTSQMESVSLSENIDSDNGWDHYDVTMNFDLTTLGATMDQISEGMSCSIYAIFQ